MRTVPGGLRLAPFLAAALVVTGCTDGDSGGAPSRSSAAAPSASSSGASSGALATVTPTPSTFPALVATPAPAVATVSGRIADYARPDRPVVVGVQSVTATPTSTVLAYTLSAPTTVRVTFRVRLRSQTEGIALVVRSAGQRLRPLRFAATDAADSCVCSNEPTRLGPQPVYQTLAFPPLPASVSEVDVRVPDLEPVTVPVTRA